MVFASKLSLNLFVFAVNDRVCSSLEVLLGDEGARVEIYHCEGVAYPLEGRLGDLTPAYLYLLPTRVKSLKEL